MEQIMNMEFLMQFSAYAFMAIGGLAFAVSMVTQVIKEMPFLKQIPTNVVVLAVSMILCPAVTISVCQYFAIRIMWYYVFASFVASFVVYLVSTGGWERVNEMWNRTKYNQK